MWVPKLVSGTRMPRWCALPTPGEWALAVSADDTTRSSIIGIDVKRVYTIADTDGDIVVPGLGSVSVKIFHHRDGGVLVASTGGRVRIRDASGMLRDVSSDPERMFESEELIIDTSLGEARMQLRKQSRLSTVKAALSDLQSEDAATRANTVYNKKKREESPLVKMGSGRTPPRVKKKNRVRFAGLASPSLTTPRGEKRPPIQSS